MTNYSGAKKIILAERKKLELLLRANNDMEIALERIHNLGGREYFVNSHFDNVFLHQPSPTSIDFSLDGEAWYCDDSAEARGQGFNHDILHLKSGKRIKRE